MNQTFSARSLRRIFLGSALLAVLPLFSSSAHAAGKTLIFPTDSTSKVKIEIESWLDACPPAGMASFVLRIKNDSNAAHDWTLTVNDGYGGAMTTTLGVSVPAGRSAEFPFVAGAASTPGSYYRTMNFMVNGYGSHGGIQQIQQPDTVSRGHHSTATPFFAISAELSAIAWGALSGKFDTTGSSGAGGSSSGVGLDATQADVSRAPDDWRGFSGLSQLWMTDGEWSAMGGGARAAMLDWIALGGRVVLFTSDSSETRLDGLKVPPPGSNGERRIGAGKILLQPWNRKMFPLEEAYKLATTVSGDSLPAQLGKYDKTWSLREAVAVPSLRALLIFGFIVAFGVLVGPVNLYWFAGPKRRQRLFWTTPLISLAGSALLMALMILQDGVGGSGARRVLAVMLPEQNKLALVQEQISRTGVLLGRSFAIEEPSWMQQVPGDASGAVTPGPGPGGTGARLQETDQRRRSGDWFMNRAVQAQVIEATRPSRGHIEFFPGKRADDPPSVLSSLSANLEQVYVVDEERRLWRAEDVGTGEKKMMTLSTREDFSDWLQDSALKQMGPVSAAVLKAIIEQPGQAHAYAVSNDAAKFAVKTLDSIRWNDDRVVFAGKYVRR